MPGLSVGDVSTVKIEGSGFDTRFEPTTTGIDRVSLTAGPKMVTGNPLDVAMNGNTVLGVTASNGDLAFTRRGDMRVNNAGQLEIGTGQAVRGQSGALNVPPDSPVRQLVMSPEVPEEPVGGLQ